MKGATIICQYGGLLSSISNETFTRTFQDTGSFLSGSYAWVKSSLVLGCSPYQIGSRASAVRLEEERLARHIRTISKPRVWNLSNELTISHNNLYSVFIPDSYDFTTPSCEAALI